MCTKIFSGAHQKHAHKMQILCVKEIDNFFFLRCPLMGSIKVRPLQRKTLQNLNVDINVNWFGSKGTPDLPGLTQVIRAVQEKTYVTTLVGDDHHCVLGWNGTEKKKRDHVTHRCLQKCNKVSQYKYNLLINLPRWNAVKRLIK